ncbi:hypothetical protein [Burkholderia multivorans]|uniref:hypothetical protein n=1 Tax=Burkholderia multivorans TaxID=87883 RepID=UPI00158D1026|nr:hypothetical protein [Burkholderia multivorans]MDR8877549.1 hypothetical protein [Burkholderia multivorans]MDR8882494.1 hypothetical protein [Burkholderia multivorans]MDR8889445.1 hypothetical protein [Burkholderia multivorans]MDR8908798.1 hypothetical protein [Burkholderia multivorans]MDR8913907.1 hypothetical protein [Burkholderia multivorans]
MYGMLFVDLAMLVLVVEVIRLGAGIRRAVVWRGAYPVMAFAAIGAVAEWIGAPLGGYLSMYVSGLISAFLGPLVSIVLDHRGGRGARSAEKVLREQMPTTNV